MFWTWVDFKKELQASGQQPTQEEPQVQEKQREKKKAASEKKTVSMKAVDFALKRSPRIGA